MTQRYHDLAGQPGDTIAVRGAMPLRSKLALPTEDVQVLVDYAARAAVWYWREFLDGRSNGLLHPDVTPGMAAYYFVNAKYRGGDYPRYLSLAFAPEQIQSSGGKAETGSIRHFMDVILDEKESAVGRIAFVMNDDFKLLTAFAGSLPMLDHRMPLDFPALKARDIMDEFCPVGGSVLDPCAGWGGRHIGFLLAEKPKFYVGCDPSPASRQAFDGISDTLYLYAEEEKKAVFFALPFEDAPVGLIAKRGVQAVTEFDLAFTSPPYFDIEKYPGKESSWRRYKTIDAWIKGFYEPLIRKTHSALKPGSMFVLNVGNHTHRLADKAVEIATAVGFKYEGRRTDVLKKRPPPKAQREPGQKLTPLAKDDTGEVFLLLRKVK